MSEVDIENLPDEFIVKHRHYHCEMEIEGYEIMNPEQFKKLQTALQSKGNVPLPNTPGHWDSDLPISDLVDAFQVISESQEEVDAFRKIFGGDSIGITDLSASVLETYVEELLDGDFLSKEIAEAFLDDPESIDLSEFRTISDEAAEILSKCKGGLCLDGLTELSDSAAESLSKHEGILRLDGLTELSDAAAGALSKCQGDFLSLGGLTELSDAAAESLSKCQGDLSLNSLTELSDAAADALSKCPGDFLSLGGLTELSDAAAESLSKYKGNFLSLGNSLEKLDDSPSVIALFHRLMNQKPNEHGEINIYLSGLKVIPHSVLEILSKSKSHHFISLGGITNLSDLDAKTLSESEGKLSLDGIKRLSEIAAESLSKMRGSLKMDELSEIHDAPAYISLIQKLSKHESGELVLDQLSELTEQAAQYLSKIQPEIYISLEGLTKISDEAAQSLAKIDRDNITLPAEIEKIVDRYRVDEEDEDENDDWDEEGEDDWEEEE